MADDEQSQDDKTEEASPERREEFRGRGQVAVSKEVTSVFILAACVTYFTFAIPSFIRDLGNILTKHFEGISTTHINRSNVLDYAHSTWAEILWIITPMFVITTVVSTSVTFGQTRLNVSFKRMKPDFSKMNPIKGLPRMVSGQAAMELFKGIAKMMAVSLIGYLIVFSERNAIPGLMNLAIPVTWTYWATITKYLFWAVAGVLLFIAASDYIFNFITLERKLKMTKKEVKEEFKKREVDPHLKGKMRRMARDLATRRTLEATEQATVLIANPTHYSIALRYELGMSAPIVVAKGIDHIALMMREVANDHDIPIVENRPLARELYASVEDGEEIPDKLFTVVAEIIRYVFKLKGRALSRENTN